MTESLLRFSDSQDKCGIANDHEFTGPLCPPNHQENDPNILKKIDWFLTAHLLHHVTHHSSIAQNFGDLISFSVHSDRFFNELVSPQRLFFLITTIFALNYRLCDKFSVFLWALLKSDHRLLCIHGQSIVHVEFHWSKDRRAISGWSCPRSDRCLLKNRQRPGFSTHSKIPLIAPDSRCPQNWKNMQKIKRFDSFHRELNPSESVVIRTWIGGRNCAWTRDQRFMSNS
jgi:hypothetical protein